jgi:hypothetical protein
LPFAANAFARRDGVVRTPRDRFFDRHALGTLGGPDRAEDAAAGGSQLRIAVLGEDALLEIGARHAITPRPKLPLIETIELHADHLVRGGNGKTVACSKRPTLSLRHLTLVPQTIVPPQEYLAAIFPVLAGYD